MNLARLVAVSTGKARCRCGRLLLCCRLNRELCACWRVVELQHRTEAAPQTIAVWCPTVLAFACAIRSTPGSPILLHEEILGASETSPRRRACGQLARLDPQRASPMIEAAASDSQRVAALLDFSTEALCVFDFQSLSLVFCNAPAARLIKARDGSAQPGALNLFDITNFWLGSYSQRVVEDMLARFQQGQAYVWEPRTVSGAIVSSFAGQYHKGGCVDGILVRAKGVELDALGAPPLCLRHSRLSAIATLLGRAASDTATPASLQARRRSSASRQAPLER